MALVEDLDLLLPDRLTPLNEREHEIAMHAMASAFGKCIAIAEQKVAYAMPIPCPDGEPGCLVFHSVPGKRDKTIKEIAEQIRALSMNQ